MTSIATSFGHPDYADADLCASIGGVLERSELAALATERDGEPHVATVSYAYTKDMTLYFISAQADVHSQDLAANPSAAVAVWTTPETWGSNLQGLQLFGTCEELGVGAEFLAAMRLYLARFPAFTALLKTDRVRFNPLDGNVLAERVMQVVTMPPATVKAASRFYDRLVAKSKK